MRRTLVWRGERGRLTFRRRFAAFWDMYAHLSASSCPFDTPFSHAELLPPLLLLLLRLGVVWQCVCVHFLSFVLLAGAFGVESAMEWNGLMDKRVGWDGLR